MCIENLSSEQGIGKENMETNNFHQFNDQDLVNHHVCSEDDEDSDEAIQEEDDQDETVEEEIPYEVTDSADGKNKLWRPILPDDCMPKDDLHYDTLDAAVKMYEEYADKGGFGTRLNSITRNARDNSIQIRYVVCNRNGKIPDKSKNTLHGSQKERNSSFKITDCKALIKFERVGRTCKFKIREFQEWHNHPLESPEERKRSKRRRQLSYGHKCFIMRSSQAKLGATKSHNLRTILEGGYENMGPEVTDYKNFKRKIGNIIGDRDAQLVVNKMLDTENELPNYTFEFDVVDSELNCMFWADETDKAYYKEFGDVISFDATFRTNKYGMRFVPFTAIDHHKKNITVGAALISNESIESYKWLLNSFLKAHKKQPTVVLTDQHPAVIQAIQDVFPDSSHRWCMWHITEKLPMKVSPKILQTTDFKKRFHDLVWDESCEPDQFEQGWNSLVREYKHGLTKPRWFKDMFRDRIYWVPAYFKHMPMHGLMKTTSRSESANSFFDKFTDGVHFLVYFMMNYDTAIAKQRNNQRDMEHGSKTATYDFKIPSDIERHAAKVYTKTIFLEVRKELHEAAWGCSIDSLETINAVQVIGVTHVDKEKDLTTRCKVELKLPEVDINCTCQHYIHEGILCRHIFRVLMNNRIEQIPEKYILRRWRKDVIANHLLASRHCGVETQDETFRLISKAYNNMEYCLDLVKDRNDDLVALVEKTQTMVNELETIAARNGKKLSDKDLVTSMLGVRDIEGNVGIKSPPARGNIGPGTKKRMRSNLEKAKDRNSKKKKTRKCRGCNEYAGHNWATCEVRIAREAAEKE